MYPFAKIQATIGSFRVYFSVVICCFALRFGALLSDAKILENINQHILSRDFARDGSEGVDGFADVLTDEVGRDAEGEAFAGAEEGSAGIGEGLDVALVCDQGCVAVCEEVAL